MLRGKTLELVEQEFWDLPMAHFAIRGLMHEATLKESTPPRNELSFLHAMRVVQRRVARYAAIPPWQGKALHEAILKGIPGECVASNRDPVNPRGVKRKMCYYPLRPRVRHPTTRIDPAITIFSLK